MGCAVFDPDAAGRQEDLYRALNRAVWSSWALSRTLLKRMVQTFIPKGPVICALDPTLERRRGAKIKAKGIYRDPVRSSKSHFVKASGLRWLSLMLLAPIPWANRVWALPFLTCLAPSQRSYEGRTRAHKKVTDWGRQMITQLRRWVPARQLVIVADSSFAIQYTPFVGREQEYGQLANLISQTAARSGRHSLGRPCHLTVSASPGAAHCQSARVVDLLLSE